LSALYLGKQWGEAAGAVQQGAVGSCQEEMFRQLALYRVYALVDAGTAVISGSLYFARRSASFQPTIVRSN
jgi:hypothetical protein